MRGFDPRLGLLQKKKSINLRGYSLIGKTAILHIVILGSSPNISNVKISFQISNSPFLAKKHKKV